MNMRLLRNPIPDIGEAVDAASKIVSLEASLLMLNQELKAVRQLKRMVWMGVALFSFNLMMTLSFLWVGVHLYRSGWTPLSVALTSFLFFGILAFTSGFLAYRVGIESTPPKEAQ